MKPLLILLAIFAGTVEARVLSCGLDEQANPNANCATCFPGYTKNTKGICVPEVQKPLEFLAVETHEVEAPSVINQNLLITGVVTIAAAGIPLIYYAMNKAIEFRENKFNDILRNRP
jgi:hypothetical protein